MAADLFETYAVSTVATMVLASILFRDDPNAVNAMMLLPLAIGGTCIIASIIGTYFVRLGANSTNIMGALYKGLIAAGVLSVGGLWAAIHVVNNGFGAVSSTSDITGQSLFLCGLVGLAVTA